ncbi:flagellar associated protein [Dunaliella salina]|uniref:Flagellar associated protein n=1 Tax=Dunaliella salina TaxID=3046 RepID=A0ABQ7G6Y1_DUNSA|nr:flagellar associated protein [Dunaliella salina]|eukprot:KAF5830367.1 flagellar associated protein [Dunaliella salina]
MDSRPYSMPTLKEEPKPPVFYDIDRGHKSSLAKTMRTSPIRYSCMRSTAPRFPREGKDSTPFGVYDLSSTTPKKSIENCTRDSRRFYAASFESRTPRFRSTPVPLATDASYNVDKVMNSDPATTSKVLESSPVNYSILRSKYKRFNDKPGEHGEGPDALYDVDSGPKASLQKSIATSPIKYGNMRAGTGRHKGEFKYETPPSLGPGTYNYEHPKPKVSPPLSSMISRSSRFAGQRGGPGLGSTWSQEKDLKAGWSSGPSISKTEYTRPVYMPKSLNKK